MPVFRHGRLRLYLLKLLDEAPRHGYEVIRLLQDRFMGVYAPSPGTIYPRLARLEEEGLVTHDASGGRKIYRITDKGRAEIQARLDDLADLEQEITDSVRDIAREVTEDVRDTVRSLREELTWASREVKDGRERDRDAARERAQRAREAVRDSARLARQELLGAPDGADTRGPCGTAGSGTAGSGTAGSGTAGAADAGAAGVAGTGAAGSGTAGTGMAGTGTAGTGTAGIGTAGAGGAAGPGRAGKQRPGDRGDGPGWPDWPGWAGRAGWASWRGWADHPGRPGWAAGGSHRPDRPDAGMVGDLERLALDFAKELRSAAWHTETLGTDGLADLRAILEDALVRIRDEVFGNRKPGQDGHEPAKADAPDPDSTDQPGAS
jgi:DNA-binding PadR family transcriptional regulator